MSGWLWMTLIYKRRLAYVFPFLHLCLCFIGVLGSRVLGWERLDVVGQALAVAGFPIAIVVMTLAWSRLPEFLVIGGFIAGGTLWWNYLGHLTEAWIER